MEFAGNLSLASADHDWIQTPSTGFNKERDSLTRVRYLHVKPVTSSGQLEDPTSTSPKRGLQFSIPLRHDLCLHYNKNE